MSIVREQLRPKTPPFAHQWEALERGGNKYAYAFLMDPGTGKTKLTIDNATWLHNRAVIDALLILAPGDVPEQWLNEQLPLHWSGAPLRTALWRASSARARRECLELSTHPVRGYFTVLAMNHEALATARGVACAKRFLETHRVLFVLDESDAFKTPRALRTRAALKLAPSARVRRILTGTVADTPFDLFSQFAFLDERILGFDSFHCFKHHYGVFAKEFVKVKDPKTGKLILRPYELLQHYTRLEELYARIDKFSYKVTKEQCTDLPPKLYSTLPTHLSPNQRALYDSIKEQGLALMKKAEAGEPVEVQELALLGDEDLLEMLQSSSNRVTASIALVVMLRLQQCVGGFVTDDTGRVSPIDGDPIKTPRIADCVEKVRSIVQSGAKVIVWAQFRAELEALSAAIGPELSAPHVTRLVHGGVTGAARTEAFNAFKDPKSPVRVLIAHPRTAGVGMNFAVATSVIYYSNGYSYRMRKQSEDRVHRIGQTGTVNIYDMRANEVPLDAGIAKVQAEKRDIGQAIMTWRSKELEARC
jgi:SNF2 family DNA or RNA helicase